VNKKTTPRNKMTGFAARGGLDIEPRDYTDSGYWQRGAERAMEEFYDLAKCDEKANRTMFKYWREENTWMYIWDRTQHALDLLKEISKKA
jgi:hypothetical protein